MHELALAQSILEIGEEEARKRPTAGIRRIRVRLGEFTGVVPEALEFSFQVAKQGTLAENAELEIERVPLQARCPACGGTAWPTMDLCLICPACSVPVEIISGREMQVEYVDLDEGADEETGCRESP